MITRSVESSTNRARPVASKVLADAGKRRRLRLLVLQVGIVVLLLGVWQLGTLTGHVSVFLFSSPQKIVDMLVQRSQSGDLLNDVTTTAQEALVGFLVGAVGGSVFGLLLWYSRFISDLSAPFIAMIGSIPVLAIAPMTIIWFGTGMTSKVMIVAFSCVVVSLTTAYKGAMRTDVDLINLMRSFNASRSTIFRKLVIPHSMGWVISGLKLNVGFSLVGAIVAEYISSDSGVGHMILMGSSNFSMNMVLCGVMIVMVMMLAFGAAVNLLERMVLSWEK